MDLKGRKIEEGEIICPYCEGPFIGKYKAYYKNGKVLAEGQFYGLRCGTWHFYNKDGELIKKVQYKTKCEK